MQLRDLREKNLTELQRLLTEQREVLRDLRFKASQRQLKNVRELRRVKKYLAQIMTALTEKNKQ